MFNRLRGVPFVVASAAVVFACDREWPTASSVDTAAPEGGSAAGALADEDAGAPVVGEAGPPVPVLEHHNGPTRDGLYVVPGLTRAAAAGMHLDDSFAGRFSGLVNAQPLYVPGPDGGGAFFVATASNDVIALDETTGDVLWKTNLGPPATHLGQGCKGARLGIAGTPVIDLGTGTLYVNAIASADDGLGGRVLETQLVHALSIADGSERSGWPVDANAVRKIGGFDPTVAYQRGALALVNGMLFVPYGSQGDCGSYHGTVMAIDLAEPDRISAWSSPAPQAGIWATNGVASDGANVFFATGNGRPLDPDAGTWGGGEALFRFRAGPLSADPDDYYVAPEWQQLDLGDRDFGGSGALLIVEPQSSPSTLAISLGKDGNLYLIDALDMDGRAIGAGVPFLRQVATKNIVTAPAAVPNARGTMVIFDGQSGAVGVGCPAGQQGDLVGVQIVAGAPPTAQVAWCQAPGGHGSPIVTTTDGQNEAIVWLAVSNGPYAGSGPLTGFDANTGTVVHASGDPPMSGLGRFNTLIAADGRLAVGADNRLYVFAFQ